MRPGTTTIGYVDDVGSVLAAASYSGNEVLNLGILFRRPDAVPGLGRAALGGVLQAASEREECTGIMLSVRPENQRALSLYASLGFTAFHRANTAWLHLSGQEHIAQAMQQLQRSRPTNA